MTGIRAITPISPTTAWIVCSIHHSKMVIRQTNITQYCLRVKGSLVGRIGLISIFPSPSGERAGRYDTSSSSHIRIIEIPATGRATPNHCAQLTAGSMAPIAIRFCGDEMGEHCPPILAASAIASCHRNRNWMSFRGKNELIHSKPTIRHGAKADFGGSVRNIGYEEK